MSERGQHLRTMISVECKWLLKDPSEYLRFQLARWTCWKNFSRHNQPATKNFFYVCTGSSNFAIIILSILKSFQLAGYKVFVIGFDLEEVNRYYRLLDDVEILKWHEFFPHLEDQDVEKYCSLSELPKSREECVHFKFNGVDLGLHILAQIDRDQLFGGVSREPGTELCFWQQYRSYFRWGLQSVLGCHALMTEYAPDIIWSGDYYINGGVLIDVAVQRKINTFFTCHLNYRPEYCYAKRFKAGCSEVVFQALSDKSWERILPLPWTPDHEEKLMRLYQGEYLRGRWNVHWKVNGREAIISAESLRERLMLSAARKVVFICPPILWVSSTYSGVFYFTNFEEWFIKVLHLAKANTDVDWVIKIHPGNGEYNKNKNFYARQNYTCARGSKEMDVIYQELKEIPPHFRILDYDSEIATCSCFSIMDVCLTISNFIALEAGCFGVPTITAGRNYYSHKGFTIDAESQSHYLEIISKIKQQPRLSERQTALAQKYMYAMLHLKVYQRESFTVRPAGKIFRNPWITPKFKDFNEFRQARDIRTLVNWVCQSDEEDYLNEAAMAETWPESGRGS